MANESIPLWDGESSGAEIIYEDPARIGGTSTLRSRRKSPRKDCERIHVCFSPDLPSGLVEHAECPVVNMSATGFAIEYDREIKPGIAAYISYQTVGHLPVRISCTVRRCKPLEGGLYVIGIQLDRKLEHVERRPVKVGPGREVFPGIRARKLRTPAETG